MSARIPPGTAAAGAFSVFCVFVATALRWLLGWVGDDVLPFPTYYPAVLFATLIAGRGAGLLATLLGGTVGWFLFLRPNSAFFPITSGEAVSLAAYLVASLLIVWGADRYRRLSFRLETEEEHRKLIVSELAHRLKNKVATLQSIIYYRLRDHPEIRDDVTACLGALSSADNLIMAAEGRGADLQAILTGELGPYDLKRVELAGPSVILPPKLALSMALVLHELATNAAKYGALSVPHGHLAVRWSLADRQLSVDWTERDGPAVTPPATKGFGTRLMTGALDPFGGSIETRFDQGGLTCRMRAELPAEGRDVYSEMKIGSAATQP